MPSRRITVFIRHRLAKHPGLQKPYLRLYRWGNRARYEEFLVQARNVAFLLPWRQPDGSMEAAKVVWDYEDMVRETLVFGTFVEEYVRYRFDLKSEAERRTYLTDAVRNDLCLRINKRRAQALLADKYKCSQRYKDYYGRETLLLYGDNDLLRRMFLNFVARHGEAVAKPLSECAGRGVRLLPARSQGEWWQWFSQNAPSYPGDGKDLIIEERIDQDPRMEAWHPGSVNTIRANTICANGHYRLFSTFLRTGRGKSFMDNCGQGGLMAAVDPRSGVVVSEGCNEQGDRLAAHPDSGMAFKGTQLPDWEGLKKLVETLARITPKLTFVAWDLALTPNGWVMVEGNKGQFMVQQIVLQHGIRKEFEEAIRAIQSKP